MTLAFFWTSLILLSFAGWGIAVTRLVRWEESADLGIKISVGLALVVIVGGILDATGAVSVGTVTAIVVTGCAIAAVAWARAFAQLTGDAGIALRKRSYVLLVVGLLALVLARTVMRWSSFGFNAQDDYQAYMVFPQLMLDTGSLIDPFNGRRLMSALGGQSFLDSIVLAWLSFQNLRITDGVLGFAALLISSVAVAGGWDQTRNTANRFIRGAAMALAVAGFGVLEARIQVNLSSTTTGTVLLFAIARLLGMINERPKLDVAGCVVVGICCAAVCTLKSTLIPAAAFMVLANLVIMDGTLLRRIATGTCILGVSIIALGPWMWGSMESSGTMLYPIFGRGFYSFPEGIAYGDKASMWTLMGKLVVRLLPLFGMLMVFAWLARWPTRKLTGKDAAWIALLLGCIGGVAGIALGAGGDSIVRYSMPLYYACVLAVVGKVLTVPWFDALFVRVGGSSTRIAIGCAVLVLSIACVVISIPRTTGYHVMRASGEGWNPSNAPLASRDETERFRRMQDSVPDGVTLLARMEKPFLLDLRRNRVYTMDFPCATSPPPGIPCLGSAEAVAGYLRGVGVRYVAYDYASDGGYPEAVFRTHSEQTNFAQTIVTVTKYALEFDHRLKKLYQTYPRLYDDGRLAVLDLGG